MTRKQGTPPRISHVEHLWITGSRRWGRDEARMMAYVRKAVARAKEHGWTILISERDHGVERAVIAACKAQDYDQLIVVGFGVVPRYEYGFKIGQYTRCVEAFVSEAQRGVSRYTLRDRWLARTAQHGLFLQRGKDRQVFAQFAEMRDSAKASYLITF